MSNRILFLVTDPEERGDIEADLAVGEEGLEKFVVGGFDEAIAAIQAHRYQARNFRNFQNF